MRVPGCAAGDGASQAAGPQAEAHAGYTATLGVSSGLRDLLVSRDAPNTVRLSTPWKQASAGVSGPAHPEAKYGDHYRRVHPLKPSARVPLGTPPGLYSATLSARLFVCPRHRSLCTRRNADVAGHIQVVAADETAKSHPILLADALLAAPRRFR